MAEKKPNHPCLENDRLKEFLVYSEETGEFTWAKDRPMTSKGCRAGYKHAAGYWEIIFERKRYLAHRLAWFFVYGEWPRGRIDHINGNGRDNRIENLRLATGSQNIANSKRSVANTSGFKGVSLDKRRGTWNAYIVKDYKRTYLGGFPTPQDAHEAYKRAAVELHGEFARFV
jgi:hypothetical protein